jgi:hypothetical protein
MSGTNFPVRFVVVYDKKNPKNVRLNTKTVGTAVITPDNPKTLLATLLRQRMDLGRNQARHCRLHNTGRAGDFFLNADGSLLPVTEATQCSECHPAEAGGVGVVVVNATRDDLDPHDPKLAWVVKNAKKPKRDVPKPKKKPTKMPKKPKSTSTNGKSGGESDGK